MQIYLTLLRMNKDLCLNSALRCLHPTIIVSCEITLPCYEINYSLQIKEEEHWYKHSNVPLLLC